VPSPSAEVDLAILEFYNGRRSHTAPGDRTPEEKYFIQSIRGLQQHVTPQFAVIVQILVALAQRDHALLEHVRHAVRDPLTDRADR